MIGKGLLTAGLALSLLTVGSAGVSAHHKPASGAVMTCQHTTLIGYQGIIINVSGYPFVLGQPFTGDYAVNGVYKFHAAADVSGAWAFAVTDGANVVTDTVNGTVVASCLINISGAIYP